VFRNKIAVVVAALAVVAAGVGVAGYASATAKAGPNVCRAKSDDSLHARSVCQSGEVPFSVAGKGAKGDPGVQGPDGPAGKDGDNAIKVTSSTITLNADFTNAGSEAGIDPAKIPAGHVCRYLTISGLPAYSSTVSELEFDNSGSADVSGASVIVRNVGDAAGVNTLPKVPGQTAGTATRKFEVCGKDFVQQRSFTVRASVLSIVG
jgi:hypothetical protein